MLDISTVVSPTKVKKVKIRHFSFLSNLLIFTVPSTLRLRLGLVNHTLKNLIANLVLKTKIVPI